MDHHPRRKSKHRYSEDDDDDILHGLKAPRRDDYDDVEEHHKGKNLSFIKDMELVEKEKKNQTIVLNTTSNKPDCGNLKAPPQKKVADKDEHAGQEQSNPQRTRFRQARMVLLDESSGEDDEDDGDDEYLDDLPGAIPVQGVGRSGLDVISNEETSTIMYSMGGSNRDNEIASRSNVQPNSNDEHLVTAELAPEPPEIVRGTPISKIKRRLYLCILLAVIIGIALFLGLYFGFDRDDDTGENKVLIVNVTESPTESLIPTRSATAGPTQSLVPSAGPTQSASAIPTQSLVPTAVPSVFALDWAITILSPHIPGIPNGTIQEHALEWIVNNDAGLILELSSGGADEDHLVGKFLDRYALVVLYLSTRDSEECEYGCWEGWDGSNGWGWLSEVPVCLWRINRDAFPLCDGNDRVSTIWFDSNRLRGTIPTEIGVLTALSALLLNDNELTGSIPTEIGLLTALSGLRLDSNSHTGTIPEEIFALEALASWALNTNHLTGSISPEIGAMTALEQLSLGDNALSGTIPTEIGSLRALEILWLHNNAISGSIPTEISSMLLLRRLDLYGNGLIGNIPTEIGAMIALTDLELQANLLTGTIPTEIGSLTALTQLELCAYGDRELATTIIERPGNRLTGTIPTEIGFLTALEWLELQDNALKGSIPTEISACTVMHTLALWNNALTGSIPSEVGILTGLTGLGFSNNALTGTIPTEIGALSALVFLPLQNNALTGTVPTEIIQLTALDFLFLSNNSLTGTIPIEVAGFLGGIGFCYLGCNDDLFGIPRSCLTWDNGCYPYI